MADPSRFERGARGQAWLMLAVLVVGFGLGVATLAGPGPQQRLRAAMTPAAFLGGQTASAVNYAMAHDLPIGTALTTAGGVLRWRVFDSGGPQVTVGCRGWLYLTEELRPWPDGSAAMAARAAALHTVANDLRAKGIALQVVLVPDKARIETVGRCGGVPYSAQSGARYAAFAALLGGIDWVDLRTAYEGVQTAVYYRTDTHWNQDGARHRRRRARIGGHHGADRPGSRRSTPSSAPDTDRAGDLLRLMGLDHVPDLADPAAPPARPRAPGHHHGNQPARRHRSGLLDAAPVPEVALVGSSYSTNANFHGALEQALASPGRRSSRRRAAGSGAPPATISAAIAFRETPPKLVVWEIPERAINQPVGEEEAAFLHNWQGR